MAGIIKTIKITKIISILFTFCFVAIAMFAMAPPAFAATSVNVGATSLTDGTEYNTTTNTLTGLTSGTVLWNNAANTLTLNNAQLTTDIKIEGDITIVLISANEIAPTAPTVGTAGALHVNGTTIIQGNSAADSLTATGDYNQDGILIGNQFTLSNEHKPLTINNATVNVTGGSSNATAGRNGIFCGTLTLNGAVINAQGGPGNAIGGSGGHGIHIAIKAFSTAGNATNNITATGGDGVSSSGGNGIRISSHDSNPINNVIENTTITVTGGDGESNYDGGAGINVSSAAISLTLKSCEIISATGGNINANGGVAGRGGYGMYLLGNFTLENSKITGNITGGNSISNDINVSAGSGGTAIFISGSKFTMINSEITGTITGGRSINTAGGGISSAGRGMYLSGEAVLNNSSIKSVRGGAGIDAGNAIFIGTNLTMENNSTIESAVATNISDFNRPLLVGTAPHAIFVSGNFTMRSGASIGSAEGGSCIDPGTDSAGGNLSAYAGDGIYVIGEFSLDGAATTASASGGNAISTTNNTIDDAIHAGHGVRAAELTLTNGAGLSSYGGDSVIPAGEVSAVPTNNAGSGINVTNGIELSGGSIVNAFGGAAGNNFVGAVVANGGNGVRSVWATLNDTSKLTAIGGVAIVSGTGIGQSIGGHGVQSAAILNGSSQLIATGGNAQQAVGANPANVVTSGYGVNSLSAGRGITINSDNVVLTATGGSGTTHALSHEILSVPTPTQLMFSIGTSSATATAYAYANLPANYHQNAYVQISYSAPVVAAPNPAIAPLTGVYR